MRCAFCDKACEEHKKCGGCRKRFLCSKECQVKDWKLHKHFCGKSCEYGIDYELKAIEGTTETSSQKSEGQGVFALRDIQKNEIILVVKDTSDHKMRQSTCKQQDYKSGHGFNMFNFRHVCRGGCYLVFHPEFDCNMIISMQPIKKGQEIRFSYIDTDFTLRSNRQSQLSKLNIICKCKACLNDHLDAIDRKIARLTSSILHMDVSVDSRDICIGCVKHTVESVKDLIALYKKYPYPIDPITWSNVYFLGFEMCGLYKQCHVMGKKWIKLAYEKHLEIGVELEETIGLKKFCDDPFIHERWALSDYFEKNPVKGRWKTECGN